MSSPVNGAFLAGVIEGFYGQPWAQAQRFQLFAWMREWGLNTYLYAPKDDLKHRALWRESYDPAESELLRELMDACRRHQLRFIYALSPGLDVRYGLEADRAALRRRLEQLLALGGRDVALLFDDIPDLMDAADLARWGSLAAAQSHLVNELHTWLLHRAPEARLLFCPTPYCGRMAAARLGGEQYLETIGRELAPGIEVFWTGPEIISAEISEAHIREVTRVLRRKPLIWDNLHANDYDGRRFYCGPYAGRPPGLRNLVSGILTNPNNEFPLNYVPVRTLAGYVQASGPWEPRGAYLSALAEWRAQFAALRGLPTIEDLALFLDCYYLPYEEGQGARELFALLVETLRQGSARLTPERTEFRARAARLREFCGRLSELRDRGLFYALSRRAWELREELELLDRYLEMKARAGDAELPPSDFHLPGTYRGGMVARLQRLLIQEPDGCFRPNESWLRSLAASPVPASPPEL
jgi:protein O-GlcNAcase/histone acetyltransferase